MASRSAARRLGRLFWLWGPVFVVMAAIFAVSSLQDLDPLPGDLSDKTGHFAGYAMLAVVVLRATAGARWDGVTFRSAILAWLICVVYGASDELHQGFVPGRTVALDDWVADAAGAATAILTIAIMAVVPRRRGRTV
ncbi:MAG: VanZ family protein [Acidobacteria bacterium]|nr:VanZ family protein [Acidobacteriota bacterium]